MFIGLPQQEEREEMAVAIRYIKFSGDYDKFDEWK